MLITRISRSSTITRKRTKLTTSSPSAPKMNNGQSDRIANAMMTPGARVIAVRITEPLVLNPTSSEIGRGQLLRGNPAEGSIVARVRTR